MESPIVRLKADQRSTGLSPCFHSRGTEAHGVTVTICSPTGSWPRGWVSRGHRKPPSSLPGICPDCQAHLSGEAGKEDLRCELPFSTAIQFLGEIQLILKSCSAWIGDFGRSFQDTDKIPGNKEETMLFPANPFLWRIEICTFLKRRSCRVFPWKKSA